MENIPNDHNIYNSAIKYTKWLEMDQMVIKYTGILHCKIYPNWDFWFENIPSGNHGWMVGRQM
jgi:hypothetical protein